MDLTGRLPLFLIPSSPEFDYGRRDLPASVHYVGPLMWYPPDDAPSFLDDLPRDRPWVHATEGTIHDELDRGLREAGVTLTEDQRDMVVQKISDGEEVDVDSLATDSEAGGPA